MNTEKIASMMAELAERVPQVVADYDASVAAHEELIAAEAELLDRLAVIVRPAIQAVGNRPLISSAASGGKVGASEDELVDRLMSSWRKAKRETDASTKPLLRVPDAAIAAALKASGSGL